MKHKTKIKLEVLRRRFTSRFKKEATHTISFKHAWDGVVYAIKTQPNFRFHAAALLVVLAAGLYFNIGKLEWVVLAFTIMTVLLAETINTAIEQTVDLLTDKYHLNAKHAKDVAAGMVLVAAVFSVIIGLIIFVPYISELVLSLLD
ncbi:MAG: diacylglycerol kinase family protein [Candidatus Pacebacteria bacterium]|nr:diacylglycerol kinase family protein [Candidatus Paceibacterota bacterium]